MRKRKINKAGIYYCKSRKKGYVASHAKHGRSSLNRKNSKDCWCYNLSWLGQPDVPAKVSEIRI